MKSGLTPETLETAIQAMTARLLDYACLLVYNPLSANCRYIFSEISEEALTEKQRFQLLKRQRLVPKPLPEIMPEVLRQYDNLYDINLYIHRATSKLTVIDIRYYPRSALAADYRQLVGHEAPMLHSKLHTPYWIIETVQKFDVNWKAYTPISQVKRLWLTYKWRILTRL